MASLARLNVRGETAAGKSVGATLRAFVSGTLPGPADYTVARPPVGTRWWVRRVTGENVWLFFVFTEDRVLVIHASGSPPVPYDGK